jgi:MFS family permease
VLPPGLRRGRRRAGPPPGASPIPRTGATPTVAAERLWPLLAAQFLAAFNDNALRLALALLGIGSVSAGLAAPEAEASAQGRATLVFVVFTLPLTLMSIPAGVLADRVSKRSVIVATKAAELGLLLGAIPALAFDPAGGLVPLCILACMGSRAALLSPAKYGILPELLPEERLAAGNARLETWSWLGILGGTCAGGVLVWLAGPRPWTIGVALAALSALGLAAALRVPRVSAAGAPGGVAAAWSDAWSALRADRLLRLAVAGTVVFWALAGLVSQDVVVYAKVVLRASDAAASLPLAALAIGIGAGSLLAGRLANGVATAPLEYGLIPLGALSVAGLVLLLGTLGPGLAGTLALMLALGVASGLLAIPLNVLAQWRAPGHRRGAVIAFANTFVFAGTMAGSLGAGALSGLGFSPEQILVAASAVGALGAAAAAGLLPGALRQLVRRIARGLARDLRLLPARVASAGWRSPTRSSRLSPAWPRMAYTAFFAVWLPTYWLHYGPPSFLWLCNAANFLILIGLWTESRLLMSWQAVGLLAIEVGWTADFAARLALGWHPLGGTEYMFDAAKPLGIRLLSLYHAGLPPLLLWGVRQLGYDRRAIGWQCAMTWLLLPVGYFWFEDRNLNMVQAPFHRPLERLPGPVWFACCFALYPLILYWPVHQLLVRWQRGGGPGGGPASRGRSRPG